MISCTSCILISWSLGPAEHCESCNDQQRPYFKGHYYNLQGKDLPN
ncbi:hypothetical protein GBAR_LOCUS14064 [Geodia barretti]|uniref:Uncharacterized protein n=1 Tax=Geodia barretti TaxID=519541 RepID=A0AA35S7P2_GEOBA|nr:hypothetical protein GBAR_LOCUS14064 [Geodia barretti]